MVTGMPLHSDHDVSMQINKPTGGEDAEASGAEKPDMGGMPEATGIGEDLSDAAAGAEHAGAQNADA